MTGRYMESAFNPEPEKRAAANEAILSQEDTIEKLMKGAEILVEKNSPLVTKAKELKEEGGYQSYAQIPIEECMDAVGNGYVPEMIYAIGRILERPH